jgi:hypothetical protein
MQPGCAAQPAGEGRHYGQSRAWRPLDGFKHMPIRLTSGVRPLAEQAFVALKRGYGFARARCIGRDKVEAELKLVAMAFNLKKGVQLARACQERCAQGPGIPPENGSNEPDQGEKAGRGRLKPGLKARERLRVGVCTGVSIDMNSWSKIFYSRMEMLLASDELIK